jgi:hypothetical protein
MKTLGKGILGLGKKLVTTVGPTGARSISPLRATGVAFAGLDAADVIRKTQKARNTIEGVGTKGIISRNSSFFSRMR